MPLPPLSPSLPRRARSLIRATLPGLAGVIALTAVAVAPAHAADPASTAPAPAGQGASSPVVAAKPTAVPAEAAPQKDDRSGTRYRVLGTDGEPLRLRDKPGLDAEIVGRLPENTLVTLLEGAAKQKDDERWLPVKSDKLQGWVAARYLARETALAALMPTGPALPPDAPFAKRVTAIAGSLVGQPYVWGGTKPGGFDCSGFAQYVYTKAGVSLPRNIPDQLATGKAVQRSDLQPGDLVAFRNTYAPGLSHVGVYLGNDRFAHAADEAQGVTISSLKDDYWGPRYDSAVRLSPKGS